MRFLHPEAGWWMLAGMAALALLRWRVNRRFVASTTVRWLAVPEYRSSWFRRLPGAALAVATLLLGGALAQPVRPYSQATVTSRGLDIVIAIDLSSSMLEEMGRLRPGRPFQNVAFSARESAGPPQAAKTRLTATKEAIASFVTARRDDRIALVVFSDNAYVVSPLTFDHAYVLRYVDFIDDQLLRGEGMTAIGEGLALSNHLLAKQSGTNQRNQVVILFTDGENTKGRDPIEVLRESNAANIRVHLVSVDLADDVRNKPQVQQLFRRIVGYGGLYINAPTARDLDAASQTLDTLEKGALISRPFVRDVPVYPWFAVPALVCLALAMALRAVPFFVDQT
jgi:Ca-activated chloride channel family protein